MTAPQPILDLIDASSTTFIRQSCQSVFYLTEQEIKIVEEEYRG